MTSRACASSRSRAHSSCVPGPDSVSTFSLADRTASRSCRADAASSWLRPDDSSTVAVPRVAAAEDQLTVLESSGRSQEDAASARQLRDAVRSAREKVETLSGPGTHDEWALDLDDAQALLVTVLGPMPTDGASASPSR